MDEGKHMWSTESRKFNANLVCAALPPAFSPPPLRPYQYFERGESIYMVLYFPILSSGGNPRASPEETNAPASIPLLLILLTRRRSPTRPFPPRATESTHTYSRCVCVCVCVCVCARSARGTALHGHLMCGRIKDAGVCIKGSAFSFPVDAKPPSESNSHHCLCVCFGVCVCVCVCVCVLPRLYQRDFSVMPPTGSRLRNLMYQQ